MKTATETELMELADTFVEFTQIKGFNPASLVRVGMLVIAKIQLGLETRSRHPERSR